MIKTASPDKMPALKSLWITCFGDTREYTDFLFQNLLTPDNILVYTDGEDLPVAMLCLEPFTLKTPVEDLSGAYIYGVATDPAYRGRGLSTALLKEAHVHLADQGRHLSALVPASESLFRFYGDRGYETAFHICRATVPADLILPGPDSCVLTAKPLDKLSALREKYFGDSSLFVRWDERYLDYIGRECRFLGGEVLAASCGGEEGYAVCYPYQNKVYIKELAVSEAHLDSILAALHSRFRAEEYILSLPAGFRLPYPHSVLPLAMVKWYDKKKQARVPDGNFPPPYIAHVLD